MDAVERAAGADADDRNRMGSRRHVVASRADQGGAPITTGAGVEAKEVSARGAGAIASSVLGIEAAA
jgi:hypothetical protein